MYRIREGTGTDFSEVAVVYHDPAHSHLSAAPGKLLLSDYEKYTVSEQRKVYLVEKSGEMAGFILFYENREEGAVFISAFSIHENYVKKGIDEHLYHKMNRFAARRNMKQLQAEITTEDPIVRTFFREKGWQPGEKKNMLFRSL
jgi:L-amino acid N-acyltransferase YncA